MPKPKTMATKLIKNSFVKDVLKEYSGANQVGSDALERVDQLFQEFLVKVATAAAESLKTDDRSKVASEDVDFGYHQVIGQSDVVPDPVRFVEALKDIPFEELGEVIRLIIEWNNDEEKKLGLGF